MSINKGKLFEVKFREGWKKSFPEGFILRLNDSLAGFKNINTPCDFICFQSKKLFLIECKSHKGASISFANLTQYERLLPYKDTEDVHAGFIIWFSEKDIVIWVDINVVEKIYKDGNKSIQLKMLKNGTYDIKELPSVKKRVYLDTDYQYLIDLYKGE